MPASLATAYQVRPLASRAARIRAGRPGGESLRPAPGAGGNSRMTCSRISAWRFRSSAVAGLVIRLNSFFAISLVLFCETHAHERSWLRDFVRGYRIDRVFVDQFIRDTDMSAIGSMSENTG